MGFEKHGCEWDRRDRHLQLKDVSFSNPHTAVTKVEARPGKGSMGKVAVGVEYPKPKTL
jgi:hypothetical protein